MLQKEIFRMLQNSNNYPRLIFKDSGVLSTFFKKNNILCTFSNFEGKTLFSTSIGFIKLKGLKKITNSNLFTLIKQINYQIEKLGITFLYLRLKGTNKNKNDFFKLFKSLKVNILLVQSRSIAPHGGCKISKPRKI